MNCVTLASAVTAHAGSISEMLPKFGVIALVAAVIIAGMYIYSKKKK